MMSTSTNLAKTVLRNRIAAKMPIDQRLAGCQPFADYCLVPCAGSCGREGFHRVSMNLKTRDLMCDANCPSFQIRKTCVHVETAARCIAEMMLKIEGELGDRYQPVVAAAIVDLQTDCKEMRKGYLWLVWRSIQMPHVRTTRYGYSPDCERPAYKIGLRYKNLTQFETAACIHFLGTLLKKIDQAVA